MSSMQKEGRVQRDEQLLNTIGIYLRDGFFDWVPMGDVYEFLEGSGYSNQDIWSGLNAFSAAGLVQSVDRAGRTELRLLEDQWSMEDFPEYVAASDVEPEWAELSATNSWEEIGETRVPTLRTSVFEDFLERNSYDENDVFRYSGDTVDTVASYDSVKDGRIEYYRIVENDRGLEQDRIVVMVKFNEEDSPFQARNRHRYADEVWTPFYVLQQRNAWVNEAARNAVQELDGAVDYWSEYHDNVTPADAVELELKSLAGFDGEYDEVLEEAARRYAEHDNSRLSRFLPHYSGQVESRFVDGYERVKEGALPSGSRKGRERTPVLVEAFFDILHRESKSLSA